MRDLSFYLEKIRKTISNKEHDMLFVQECLIKTTGITIPLSSLTLKNGVLFVSVTPIKKNELFMKKEEVLSFLKKEGLPVIDLR